MALTIAYHVGVVREVESLQAVTEPSTATAPHNAGTRGRVQYAGVRYACLIQALPTSQLVQCIVASGIHPAWVTTVTYVWILYQYTISILCQ